MLFPTKFTAFLIRANRRIAHSFRSTKTISRFKTEYKDLRSGVDVADVSCNAGSASDIVESELGDERIELHEESERLAYATSGSKHGNLPLRHGAGAVASAEEARSGSRSISDQTEH